MHVNVAGILGKRHESHRDFLHAATSDLGLLDTSKFLLLVLELLPALSRTGGLLG